MEVPHEKLLVEQVVDLVFQIWYDRIPLKIHVAKSFSSSYEQYEVSPIRSERRVLRSMVAQVEKKMAKSPKVEALNKKTKC